MKGRQQKTRRASLVGVPLRWGRRLRSLPQLRSTPTREARVQRERIDSRSRIPEQRTTNQTDKNKSHRVTHLLAQRITLPGNSYFWRTAYYCMNSFLRIGALVAVLSALPGVTARGGAAGENPLEKVGVGEG